MRGRRIVGIAEPVQVEGHTAAVLVGGWHRPAVSSRTRAEVLSEQLPDVKPGDLVREKPSSLAPAASSSLT